MSVVRKVELNLQIIEKSYMFLSKGYIKNKHFINFNKKLVSRRIYFLHNCRGVMLCDKNLCQ